MASNIMPRSLADCFTARPAILVAAAASALSVSLAADLSGPAA